MKNKKSILLLLLILFFSFFISASSFYLPHNMGDQVQYLGLAMKLDEEGFSGYNLQGIDVMYSPKGSMLAVKSVSGRGNLLDSVPEYYDAPLFHKPPFFPYIIAFSHRLFAGATAFSAVNFNLGKEALFTRPAIFLKAQFYCVVVPLFFSMALIAVAYFAGRALFSANTGIFAAFLMSISPIEILCSQRIWADSMTAFFAAVALLLYFIARKKGSYALTISAGIFSGACALTKPGGHTVLAAVILYEIYLIARTAVKGSISFRKADAVRLGSFILVHLLITVPWHIQVYRHYGTVAYFPCKLNAGLKETHPWFRFVFNRPWYMFFVNSLFQTPLFIFAYFSAVSAFGSSRLRSAGEREKFIFLIIWAASFFTAFYVSGMKGELRYILPAYPAFAVLAGEYLEGLRVWINRYGESGKLLLFGRAGDAVISLMLVLCAVWSVYIGLNAVFTNAALIVMPF